MKQRDCFYNVQSHGAPSHPWVIVSDPTINPDDVLIVNLTNIENHHDMSCVLEPSDCPGFITKRSCVAYQFAKVTSVAMLEKADSAGFLLNKNQFGAVAFQKVLEGARDTDELKGAFRELLRDQLLI